jgi:hypothetical protein
MSSNLIRPVGLAVLGLVAWSSSARAGVTITNGDARLGFADSAPAFETPAFGNGELRFNGPSSGDYLNKYTWYVRGQGSNTPFSWPVTPTQSPSGSTVPDAVRLSYANAGIGPIGSAWWNATVDMSLTDGASANQGNALTTVRFSASTSNSASRTFQIFCYFDPDVHPAGSDSGESVAATRSGSLVNAQFTTTTSTDVVNVIATGNPTIVQVGEASNTISGTPLRNIVGASTSNPMSASTDLIQSPTPMNVGGFINGSAIGLQWTVTLAPGQSAQELQFAIGVNQLAVLPEPTSIMATLGAGALVLRRRRCA